MVETRKCFSILVSLFVPNDENILQVGREVMVRMPSLIVFLFIKTADESK